MKQFFAAGLALFAASLSAHAAPVAVATSASAAASPNDSIELLNQRLSERLKSVQQPTNDGSILLRVPARPIAEAAPSSAHRKKGSAATAAAAAPTVAALDTPKEMIDPPEVVHAGAWSYEGATGPQAWGKLAAENIRCATGSRQSPIDIRNGFGVDLDPVEFAYKPSAFRVIDNGHTVQVNVAPGNFINVLGRRYELQEFHFHRPSEERIDGRQFDMVVHLVHKDEDGHVAIVAVLLERGAAQSAIQMVWNNLPLEKGEEQAARAPIDLAALLPQDTRYFTYMGSLTTPPCSEGVLWMVMKQPVQVAPDQIELFSRLYPMNARPVQSLAGRIVKESR